MKKALWLYLRPYFFLNNKSFSKQFCLFRCVKVLSACKLVHHLCAVPMEARRGRWNPGIGVTDGFELSMVLRIESRFSGRAASVFNSWAISPTHKTTYMCESVCVCMCVVVIRYTCMWICKCTCPCQHMQSWRRIYNVSLYCSLLYCPKAGSHLCWNGNTGWCGGGEFSGSTFLFTTCAGFTGMYSRVQFLHGWWRSHFRSPCLHCKISHPLSHAPIPKTWNGFIMKIIQTSYENFRPWRNEMGNIVLTYILPLQSTSSPERHVIRDM